MRCAGYYDNCLFDRVIPNFIAQTANKGESIYDENEFKDEFNDRLHFNRRGLVGMVNMNKPNTNSTQFFFTLADTPELNHVNTLFAVRSSRSRHCIILTDFCSESSTILFSIFSR